MLVDTCSIAQESIKTDLHSKEHKLKLYLLSLGYALTEAKSNALLFIGLIVTGTLHFEGLC